jgi:dGTPase
LATLLTPLDRARKAALADRQWVKGEKEPVGKRYRTKQQRDRDRVLYSAALHRLAYVTQVTAPEAGYIFHNRLTHSLKVAQVGRRNAERLLQLVNEKQITGKAAQLVRSVDPDAVEASCLAHDLGHPPFGHVAEQALNECAKDLLDDPFEGNAQSFRIVTRLAVRNEKQGLDLTAQTLNGLLKYPWRRRSPDPLVGEKRKRKWGYYTEDTDAYEFARTGWPPDCEEKMAERCLEAQIMDWADDLTYAVHDVDDFFRAGLIPLDRLVDEKDIELKRLAVLLEQARIADPGGFPELTVDEVVGAAREAISRHRLLRGPYEHSKSARAAMRQFGSLLITDYLDAFTLVDDLPTGKVRLKIGKQAKREVEALKMLAVVYVIRRPSLAVVQEGQKRVVESLFKRYFDASGADSGADGLRLFPPSAKERLESEDGGDGSRARVVLDLISGLTETAAIELHNRLSGGWTSSALDATAAMG